VAEAFAQAERAREYVLSRDVAAFSDKSGTPVFTVRRRDVDEIFFVNPTLAVIDSLGAQLRLARQSGLLPESARWPWCIFVNDLRIVSELVASPSEFVLFLERRLATNHTRFAPHDELDLLCKFFIDGLYGVPEALKDATLIPLHGFTDMLDRWYIGRPHGAQVEKPGRRIPAQVRGLIGAIEATGKPRRTRAAIELAELGQKEMDEIDAFLDTRRPQTMATGEPHDMTCIGRNPSLHGLSIYVLKDGRPTAQELNHVRCRRFLTGAEHWLALFVCASDLRCDFAFSDEIETSPEIAERVDRWRRRELSNFVAREGRLPDRNEPCPCKSGRKFKSCCRSIASEVASR
jgi:hypothetical protein